MTVSTLQNSQTFLGNNSSSSFNFSFNNSVPFNSTTPLASYSVIYTDSSGNQTTLAPTVYSISFTAALPGTLWGIGGVLTYPLTGSPIASGTSLTLQRTFSLQQLISISNQGDFSPQNIEAMGDIEEMQLQQIAAPIARSIQIPVVDPSNIITTLPAAAQRASQYIAFDGSGNAITALSSPGTVPISSAMQPVVEASTTSIATGLLGYTALGTGAVLTNLTSELHLGFLHLKDFGAVGNGTTDDTAAIQAWVNACASTGLTGWFDPAPSGNYLIKSEITYNGANPLSIVGPGYYTGASLEMNSLTQNGFHFNCTGRLYLSGFGVKSSGTATAGNAFYFDSSGGNTTSGFLERLSCGNSTYNGFFSNGGIATFTMTECDATSSNVCAYFFTGGDSEIHNNLFNPVGSSAGGLLLQGDCGGLRILSNKFNSGSAYNYAIQVQPSISDGDLIITGNSIEGFGNEGIYINQPGSANFGNVIINGNELSGGGFAIDMTSTTANWLAEVIIIGNILNTTDGVRINSANNLILSGNYTSYLQIGSAVNAGIGIGNIFTNAVTNNSSSFVLVNNPGYNPVGASALSPGSSPWTYTAGGSPETLFLSDSSAITALTINGASILPHATGANVVLTVPLPPFGVAVITNTGTLTGKKMIY